MLFPWILLVLCVYKSEFLERLGQRFVLLVLVLSPSPREETMCVKQKMLLLCSTGLYATDR